MNGNRTTQHNTHEELAEMSTTYRSWEPTYGTRVVRKSDGCRGTVQTITTDGYIVTMDATPYAPAADVLGSASAWAPVPVELAPDGVELVEREAPHTVPGAAVTFTTHAPAELAGMRGTVVRADAHRVIVELVNGEHVSVSPWAVELAPRTDLDAPMPAHRGSDWHLDPRPARYVIRSLNYSGGVNVRLADDGGSWSVRIGRTTTHGLTTRAAAEMIAPAVTFPGAGITGDVDRITDQLTTRAREISREMGA